MAVAVGDSPDDTTLVAAYSGNKLPLGDTGTDRRVLMSATSTPPSERRGRGLRPPTPCPGTIPASTENSYPCRVGFSSAF
ncbi:hypothetical protein [Streptomyces sp. NPDC057199]|uniref:hypothetical protein n=1 Tax=Streptomyces sp. NPDC057199 TaxID=3346047 RepID=UPI003642970F